MVTLRNYGKKGVAPLREILYSISFPSLKGGCIPEIVFHQLFNFLSLSPGQPSGCAQEGAILSKDLELGAQVTGHQLKLTWPLLMNWLRDRMGFPLILTSLLNAFWYMTEHFRLYHDVHNFHYEDQTTKYIVMISKTRNQMQVRGWKFRLLDMVSQWLAVPTVLQRKKTTACWIGRRLNIFQFNMDGWMDSHYGP